MIGAIGALTLAVNVSSITVWHVYFPTAFVASVCSVFFGGWLAITTGRPIDPSTGKPATRWQIGAVIVTILGLVVGIWFSEAIRQRQSAREPAWTQVQQSRCAYAQRGRRPAGAVFARTKSHGRDVAPSARRWLQPWS